MVGTDETMELWRLPQLERFLFNIGGDFTTEEVFSAITHHNKELGNQDKFSTKPLVLVYRASNVQNMRFVDTPGIIANQVSIEMCLQ